MKKIRVALIHPVVPHYRVPLLANLATYKEIEITCFHSLGNQYGAQSVGCQLPVNNVCVTAIYPPKRTAALYQFLLLPVLRGRFDVVICNQNIHNIAVLLLWLLKPFFSYTFIWWGMGYDPYRQKHPTKQAEGFKKRWIVGLKNWIWKRADGWLVYTKAGKTYSVKLGIPEERVFVLNNTIDINALKKEAKTLSPTEIAETKKNLGIPVDAFTFLFIGRLHPKREVPFLIEAFSLLAAESKQVYLIIIGDGQERELVEKRILTLDLQKQVILTGAIYDNRQLSKLFLACDVVTLPAQVGLSIMHSFAMGKPVITRKTDSFIPELDYLNHDVNGLLLTKTDPENYAQALKKLWLDQEKLKTLSQGAHLSGLDFTMEKMAQHFRDGILYAFKNRR